ncbi:LysR substrate-binding domain-containing protein [Roseinatronobacter alkalisoli]|uniref:LysR substrate-binding domain-containing protein n=1 Tax=Roseinatronobacter alkalisoli TaxID=3028235 RepID=A0ABT5TEF8_9RHOB|nr:LysR substrate-binding domain-containing protein [Roseinatronobacter sp. HJB301]MDD7973495.1 LysR substrate-binding domain-containing protein [Roseinatronobacter sp. HJB301]
MRDINLKATEYFEAVARLGTVTKAAQELGVSPSAVSQQIGMLESQFGVRLFRREKRRLILTLDGDRLFQTTTQAFSALRNARNAITRQRDARALTLRVSPSFGVRWLGPRIAAFAEANPDWNIRIDATPDFSAFETETVDFDLRYGLGGWTGLTVEGIMSDLVLPLCSPDYRDRLRQHGESAAEMLPHARLIDSVKTVYRWDVWLAVNRIELRNIAYPFRFDRSSMSIEMAKQGGGVALDNAHLCRAELERGDLVPLAVDCPVIEFPSYWFVCPPRHLNRRIVRRFLDWITAEAARDNAHTRALLAQAGCDFHQGDVQNMQVIAPNMLQ